MTAQSVGIDERHDPYFKVEIAIISKFGGALGPYGIAVYVAICSHFNQKHKIAFPGLRKLAAETKMSRQQVIKEIRKLESLKLLTVDRRPPDETGKGAHKVNIYHLPSATAVAAGIEPQPEAVVNQDDYLVNQDDHPLTDVVNVVDQNNSNRKKITPAPKARDLLFEAICEHIVGAPYEKATKGDKNYARAIYGAIQSRVPDGEPMPTPEDAATFKANYLAANPTLSLPSQPHKIADWLLKLRTTQTQPADDGRLYVTADGRRLPLAQYLEEVSL